MLVGSVRIPLLFLLPCIPSLFGNSWNTSRSRADLHDIFPKENTILVGKYVSFHSHSVIHPPEICKLSTSEGDTNASLQWMPLVCSRPGSVCVLPGEIKLQSIYQHTLVKGKDNWQCLLTEFTMESLKSVSAGLAQSSTTHVSCLTNPQYLSTLTSNLLGRNRCLLSGPAFVDHYAARIGSSVCYPGVRLIMTWGFYYLLFILQLPSGSSGSAYSINFPQLNVFSGIQRFVWCGCHAKHHQVLRSPEPVR